MTLQDWLARVSRLAGDLDGLGVRYVITVGVGLETLAVYRPPDEPEVEGAAEAAADDGSHNAASGEDEKEERSPPAHDEPVRDVAGDVLEPAGGGHTHHWKLEAPNGPTAAAKCWCGETRTFKNSDRDAVDALPPGQRPHAYESGGRGRGALCSICNKGTKDLLHRKVNRPQYASL